MADGQVVYEVRADNSQLDSDLNQSEKKIKKSASDTEETIKSTSKQAGKDIDATSNKTSKLGSTLAGAGKIAGTAFLAIGSAAVAVGTKAITGAVNFDQAMNQFAASTGIAQSELSDYEDTLKNIYTNNYGESFEDIANAMSVVTQQMGDLDQASLQNITEGVFALSDVFGSDFNETLRGVDQLMLQFGISSEEALDLLAAGSQSGLNYTDELGDNIAEYAGKFSQAGYSAEEYFQLLKNGTENGAYNLDKVNDSINEVTTKLADGTIGEAIGQFSTETQALFEQWQNGGASQKQVIDSIIKDIANCTNEQEALTMAATAFGTMGEDANLDFIKSLSSVGEEFDNTKGKMEELKEVKYDDLGSMLEGLGRSVEVLLLPLGESLIPLLDKIIQAILPSLEEFLPPLIDAISGVLDALFPIIEEILPVMTEFLPMIIEPLTEIMSKILPVFGEILSTLLPPLIDIVEAILPPLFAILNAILDPLLELIQALLPPLADLLSLIAPLFEALAPIIEMVANLFSGVLGVAIEALMPIIEGIMDVLGGLIKFITGVFSGSWEDAWDGIVQMFKGIFNLIPTIIESIINGAIGIINLLIQGINSLTGAIGIPAIPEIPNVSLPRFHTGGIVDFTMGEGPALLKDGEMVLTQKQQAQLFAMANGNAYASNSPMIIVDSPPIYLDGKLISKNTMQHQYNDVKIKRLK